VSVYTVFDKGNPARYTTALFWTLFGLTFMAPIIHLPDTVVGAFLVVMALLSGFKQIRVGSAKESSVEYRAAERDKWGNKLFIPILDHTHCNVCGCSVYKVRCFDGIGAGILINGQLFQGDDGSAGEIGHVKVRGNDLPCRCGQVGCLETIASGQAVVKKFQILSHSTQPISLKDIEQKFMTGDPIARQVVLEAGSALGESIGFLVGTLNIREIILTGDMAHFGELG